MRSSYAKLGFYHYSCLNERVPTKFYLTIACCAHLFFLHAVTTNVFAVTVTQKDPCYVEITCHFASGSYADGCQLVCLPLWGVPMDEQFIVPRNTLSDDNATIVISASTFPSGILFDVEAVGVQKGRITDFHRAYTSFQVTAEQGMNCQYNKSMFCMP